MTDSNKACPCHSHSESQLPTALTYQQCCQPLHTGDAKAITPEKLMRSRYCAFAMGDLDYLTKTHHPSQRVNDNKAIAATMANTQWHGLQIVKTAAGNSIAEGYVEFIARYSEDNQPGVLHENSRFVNEDDCWFYIDGDIIESGPIKPPSRNEPCWCGSSKKFKKCHG